MALIFSADIYQGLGTHKEQEDLKNTCHWEYRFWASQSGVNRPFATNLLSKCRSKAPRPIDSEHLGWNPETWI